jgi:hypothetical protein
VFRIAKSVASPLAAVNLSVNNVCFFLNLNKLMSVHGTERKLESCYCWAFIWSAVERLAVIDLRVMVLASFGCCCPEHSLAPKN